MPGRFIPPRQISAHRIACKALYRALLNQCRLVPLPHDLPSRGPTNPLKHFIRKRFQENKNYTSSRIITTALKTGYASLQLIHSSANGSSPSTTQIHSLLRTISTQSLLARQTCQQPPPNPRPPKPAPYPNVPKYLSIHPQPKEKLTGRRHVPHIAVANGDVPFIRYKKPQSPFLSRVIRDTIWQKQMRFDLLDRLEWDKELAEAEERWEGVLERVVGDVNVNNSKEGKERKMRSSFTDDFEDEDLDLDGEQDWAFEIDVETNAVERRLKAKIREQTRLGGLMAGIVEKEKELWREERGLRRHEKLEERKLRKANRDASSSEAAPPSVVPAHGLENSGNGDTDSSDSAPLSRPD